MHIQAYIQSGIIESYVLGLASPEEVAELEKLKAIYSEVEKSISDFSLSLEEYAFKNAITPPAEVKSKIMAAIADNKEATPVVSIPANTAATDHRSTKTLRLLRLVSAASVILFIASAAVNFYLYNRYKEKNKDYEALLTERNSLYTDNQLYQTNLREWQSVAEMMADPAIVMIKMEGTPGKEQHLATIFWNTKNKDVYVMPNKLPHPANGKQFQLWALVNGKPVDAGVLQPECSSVCKMKNIPTAQAFAITLEKEGGSTTPTMQEMYVLGKV